MTPIPEQRTAAKAWLKRAARAEDSGTPLKSLDPEFVEQQDELVAMRVFGLIHVDDVKDEIAVTVAGRAWAGVSLRPVPDLAPERIAEMKGSVTETELAARMMESKVAGCERLSREKPELKDDLLWIGRCFQVAADEFRQGMHIPALVIEGRVVPYNESNDTGVQHSANLALFFGDVFERNQRAGWWSELETGEPKKRNVGELFMLFVTEIVEAYVAYVQNTPDDKLPEYPGLGVELGDLAIRMADFAGAAMAGKLVAHSGVNNPGENLFRQIRPIAESYERIRKTPQAVGDPEEGDFLPPMDIGVMIDAKLAFNANREDHKIENRLKDGGKKT